MAVLEPKLAILDETDSGLDIDALQARRQRRQRPAQPRAGDHRHHPLPAAARLHRARLRPRAQRRPHRQVRRQGAGARARGEGLRLDRDRRGAGRTRDGDDAGDGDKLQALARRARAALDRAAASRLAAGPPRPGGGDASPRSASRRRATRSGGSPTSPRSRRSTSSRSPPPPRTRSCRRAIYGDVQTGSWCSNGRFSPELSRVGALPAGVRVGSLAAAVTEQAEIVQRYLGQLAEFGSRAFTALNTALADDGAFVHIPDECGHRASRCTCCSSRRRQARSR